TGRCCRTHGGAGTAAYHGGHAAHQGFFYLLRTDEMNMGVDTACGNDHAFTSNDFRCTSDGHGHIGLDVGIAGLADCGNPAGLDTDVRLDDAPVIEDQCI